MLFGAPSCKSSWKSCRGISIEADERAAVARVELDGKPRAGVIVRFEAGPSETEAMTDERGLARATLPEGTTRYTAIVDPFAQRGELRDICPSEDTAELPS